MTLDEFVALSAALTGYPADELKPARDTQGVAAALYAELSRPENKIPQNQLNLLTQTWNTIVDNTAPSEIPTEVYSNIITNIEITRLAQNIIYMWYVGIWYDLTKNPNSFDFPNNDHVISSLAYTNGLVWREMGAHPMGFSTEHYGYWENVPTLPAINVPTLAAIK